MRVMVFGSYDERSHPRIAVIREGLREHGLSVTECNAPLGIGTRERVEAVQNPWRLPRLALAIARSWVRLTRASRVGPRPDVVVVGYLGHFDVLLARALFRRSTVVLDLLVFGADTARDRGLGGRAVHAVLDLLDRAAVAAADIVLVDTEEHALLVRPAARHKCQVVMVGATREWFRAGDERTPRDPTQPLAVVFYGLFTPLQGAPTIAEALAPLDDVVVTMIGEGQDLAAARDRAGDAQHFAWRDWVPAEELPAVVAAHDVCLGILGDAPKALRVVPNKVFQGAAARCAIVTSDTPPQRRALADAAVLVPPGDAAALRAAVEALAADRSRVCDLQARAGERAASCFTGRAVAAPLVDRLRAGGLS